MAIDIYHTLSLQKYNDIMLDIPGYNYTLKILYNMHYYALKLIECSLFYFLNLGNNCDAGHFDSEFGGYPMAYIVFGSKYSYFNMVEILWF